MSKVVVTTVLPDSGASNLLTIGAASDSVAISGDSLNVDTLQDAGGNTIFVSDGSGTITSKNSGFPGALKLISTATASGAANVSITSGLDSTYDVYCFKFININPATDDVAFSFQANAVGGSGFNETITSTAFRAYHDEDDTAGVLAYNTSIDQAQGTAYQYLVDESLGNDADASSAGELHLFAPSSTTYVKHFYSRFSNTHWANYAMDAYIAGYFNTTTAIDEISFKMSSGNFDGIIKMYGISKS